MNVRAFLNTITSTCRTLPVVILYVTEGCNLQCITCSYRERRPGEMTLDEIKRLASELHAFGLRHIVYSGGEPLLRKDFPEICHVFSAHGVRQSLLTNGLLLEKRLEEVVRYLGEVIVSIDGPTAEVHDGIRGVRSFEIILKGIKRYCEMPGRPPISIRCVVQKRNFRHLEEMVSLAKSLQVHSISFLTADILSSSFGRDTLGKVAPDESITLTDSEASAFRQLVETFVVNHADDFTSKFLSDPPSKFFHMVQYFEAILGKAEFPRNHCNAPMVSAVVTSTGEILPCFFLPPSGNVTRGDIAELLNSESHRRTRGAVRAYDLQRCHTCVCTMNKGMLPALMNRF